MADPWFHAICPNCREQCIDEGRADSEDFADGLWVGCSACGFSITGAHHDPVRLAMKVLIKSKTMKGLADA